MVLLAGALGGARWNAWTWIYRGTVLPRIRPPEHLEPGAPPRFAQLLGGLFTSVGAVALGFGWILPGQILVGTVSALALLNGLANYCVGCKFYGILVRRRKLPAPA